MGSVLIRFYDVLKVERYRALATQAARDSFEKYAFSPGHQLGLSGIGEFFLDMYHFTGERQYMTEASKIVRKVLLYRLHTEEGIAFPGEDLLRICNDFATGSAGIGFFLSRFLKSRPRTFYDFEIPATTKVGFPVIT